MVVSVFISVYCYCKKEEKMFESVLFDVLHVSGVNPI